jgi:hypothetical protein
MAHHVTGSVLDGIIVVLLLLSHHRDSRESRRASFLAVLLILAYESYATIPIVAREKNEADLRQDLIEWAECARTMAVQVQSATGSAMAEQELSNRLMNLIALSVVDPELPVEEFGPRLRAMQSDVAELSGLFPMPPGWKVPANHFHESSMGVPEELDYLRSHWQRPAASLFAGQLLFVLVLAFLVHSSHRAANDGQRAGAEIAAASPFGDDSRVEISVRLFQRGDPNE